MEVIIRPNADSAAALTAALIAKDLKANPKLVMGLATGRTMEQVYSILIDLHKNEGLDFSQSTTFNLDEYIGIAPEDKNSYRYYMNERLFKQVNIKMESTNLPNGVAEDLVAECLAYDEKIKQVGGIDFQLLGIGRTGHIGFNEPLSSFQSRTRCKPLTPVTFAQNSPLFDDPSQMPLRAMTMGIATILESKNCVMLATGAEKADIISKAVEGPMTSMISATALQMHPKCVVIVDEPAAAKLEQREYYDWILLNEPKWEEFRNI
ncbi:MAG: glucosamine-6-phosphate deaminase [Lentisphaerae bacterium]|nr:glucosamine-6-phosphate deaminase [Lentisphaerota bacterium]